MLKNLLEAVGSEQKLEKILEHFYLLQQQDVMVGFFFEGKDIQTIIQRQKEFLLSCIKKQPFTGIKPQKAHKKLPPILPGHFYRRIELLKKTLQYFQLPEKVIDSWVTFEKGFAKAIITKKVS